MNANQIQENHAIASAWRLVCLSMVIGFLLSTAGRANNISVSNIWTAGQNIPAKKHFVQFDVAWENSWRTAANYDAAWLFVKYRHPATTGSWRHASLSNLDQRHTAPAGATIVAVEDGTGVFLHRSTNGTGHVNFTGVQLQWNYSGVTNQTDAAVDVQVHAIEMVYVPQGEFAVGSGGTEDSAFTLTTINTADATVAPSGTGSLGGQAGGYPTGQLPADNHFWPNGFNAFYCMKYEISGGQWAALYNAAGTVTAPDRPISMAWHEGIAYADWSCLRPMTELEFEKACRGPLPPVPNEYAWGTTDLHASPYSVINDGTPSEAISNMGTGTGNASYDVTTGNIIGALRCGIFAASTASPDRVEAGASFYGIMELSGSLIERPITIEHVTGRAFTGAHGDGALDGEGFANVPSWPNESGNGAGFRGGAFSREAEQMRVSDRTKAIAHIFIRLSYYGFRGVRTAPAP